MAMASLPCFSSSLITIKDSVLATTTSSRRSSVCSSFTGGVRQPGLKCPAGSVGYEVCGTGSRRRRAVRGPAALFGGGGKSGDGKKDDKKFITKDQEPEQYWQTADEKEGKNPMQTPLPYIALLTLLSPFAILAVAFANNWIKLPNQ